MTSDRTWWANQWLRSVEQRAQLDPNRLPRARRYARSGAVHDLEVGPAEVRASVAGRDSRPYVVRIRVRPFTADEWSQLLEAVAARATYAAALLAGDLPPEVGAVLEASGFTLVPGPAEIGPRCTCPDDADPCKHSAAVCFSVADALDADPFVVLLLRGRTRDEVLAGVRALRRGSSPGPAAQQASAALTHPEDPDLLNGLDDRPAHAAPRDPGLDAREVLGATTWDPIPDPPAPPRRPGRPAAWPIDPPAQLAGLHADLLALASDAAHRAWELAAGAASDARLTLDSDADLARRADRTLGTPAFSTLAARSGVTERELARWALAWRHGGVEGVRTLRTPWNPAEQGAAGTADLLVAARSALGGAAAGARIRGARVTAARRQLRLGRDYRWYPYARVRAEWEPAGSPASDPAVAVTRAWPPDLAETRPDDPLAHHR